MTCIKLAFNSTKWKPNLAEWLLAGQLIQSDERRRIAGFYYTDDAKMSLSARLLLRFAITSLKEVTWQDVRMKRDVRGKPTLEEQHEFKSEIYFNASHDGDYSVVVAHTEHNVGVDVMNNTRKQGVRGDAGDRTDRFFALMQSKFSTSEWSSIRSRRTEAEKMRAFYRHWCLKESYVKAIGTGVSFPLETLTFTTSPPCLSEKVVANDTTLDIDGDRARDWSFEETLLDSRHCVAVAHNVTRRSQAAGGGVGCTNFQFVDFDDIATVSTPLCTVDELEEAYVASFDKPSKNLGFFYDSTHNS